MSWAVKSVAGQTLGMMSRKNTKEQIALLRPADLLLAPPLGTIRSLDFSRSKEAIRLGEETARRVVDELRKYSLPPDQYASWRATRHRSGTDSIRIDRVRIAEGGPVAIKTIERRIGIKPGSEVTLSELRRNLDRIYVGAYDLVDFKLVNDAGRTDLVIYPHARDTGLIRARAGLKLFR